MEAPELLLTQAELATLVMFSGSAQAAHTAGVLGIDALTANPDLIQAGYASLLARDLARLAPEGPVLSRRVNAVATAIAEADDWLFVTLAHGDQRSGIVVIGSPQAILTLDAGTYGVHTATAIAADRDPLTVVLDRLLPLSYTTEAPGVVAFRRVPADPADTERSANVIIADASSWALPITSMFTASGTAADVIVPLRQALGYTE